MAYQDANVTFSSSAAHPSSTDQPNAERPGIGAWAFRCWSWWGNWPDWRSCSAKNGHSAFDFVKTSSSQDPVNSKGGEDISSNGNTSHGVSLPTLAGSGRMQSFSGPLSMVSQGTSVCPRPDSHLSRRNAAGTKPQDESATLLRK
ncbi:hypothetical protein N7510_000432 [Penicillium lagena]|uniref:uncharacterized protein n=1 Tax=Penicillium lagena TaxID=94218 RepID=UPI00253FCB87|nr:uncharacterized protein N7510_000432 [Penicillium lagena]KAJ5624123.1 hypothetical protein N7510_000432 [Penicillium lagena]